MNSKDERQKSAWERAALEREKAFTAFILNIINAVKDLTPAEIEEAQRTFAERLIVSELPPEEVAATIEEEEPSPFKRQEDATEYVTRPMEPGSRLRIKAGGIDRRDKQMQALLILLRKKPDTEKEHRCRK